MAPARVAGFYLSDEQHEAVARLAKQEGVSKSAFVGRLIDEKRKARQASVPEVVVDGRLFVPARRKSS